MAYKAEIEEGDELPHTEVNSEGFDLSYVEENDAVFIRLPNLHNNRPPYNSKKELKNSRSYHFLGALSDVAEALPNNSIVGVLTETELLPYIYSTSFSELNYQRSIAVRLDDEVNLTGGLNSEFLSLAFFTKGHDTFSITKIRDSYRYCPYCEKTTKDYGGKKHLYHSYGTLQRDVWKNPDIQMDYEDNYPERVIERTREMLSSGKYSSFLSVSSGSFEKYAQKTDTPDVDLDPVFPTADELDNLDEEDNDEVLDVGGNDLYLGDSVELLKRTPSNSVDLIFLDPPYNIGKDYSDHDDEMEELEYYQWCNIWLSECVRILSEGGVLISLNLPESIYKHYLYLGQHLRLQNWICWDSMSRPPAGNIMPTNYPILVFSKGEPSSFSYTPLEEDNPSWLLKPENQFQRDFVYPLDDNYCKRNSCIKKRNREGIIAKKELTDLWTDVYRLKHNSKREDHPTMLPPKLMRRLLWLFTDENDIVLDPFNGVGTTTLTASQMNRRYTGIEISEKYHSISEEKHEQLRNGENPFDKSTKQISPPSDSDDTDYKIPKRDLQLDVKRIADDLGKIPTKEDVEEHGKYPLKYYQNYFDSWSDVTKAAKTTGMTEDKGEEPNQRTLYSYDED